MSRSHAIYDDKYAWCTMDWTLILIILLNKTAYTDIIQGSEPQLYNISNLRKLIIY